MSETYKGGAIPADIPLKARKLLEDHDRAITRGIPKVDVTINTGSGGQGATPGGKAPTLQFRVIQEAGEINNLPLSPAGTTIIFRCSRAGTSLISETGNLHLAGNFIAETGWETITLVSDGIVWLEVARGRNGGLGNVFIPAALWGAVPDTGTNKTTQIRAALAHCPLGATLVFEPGTYLVSGDLVEDRGINIWAGASVIFDYTTAVLTTCAFQWGSTNATHVDLFCLGPKLTRTVATAATTARLYEGFRWKAMYSCRMSGYAQNFAVGHRLMGDHTNADGNAYNIYDNLLSHNCTKGTMLKPEGTADWTNENVFIGGRMSQTFSDPQNARAISVECNNGSIPNNNRWYGMSLENNWGRKLYCEGEFNLWHHCRWETSSTAADGFEVEFNQGVNGGTGRVNILEHGYNLSGIQWTEVGALAIQNQVLAYNERQMSDSRILARALKMGFGPNSGNSLFQGDNTTNPFGVSGPLNAFNKS